MSGSRNILIASALAATATCQLAGQTQATVSSSVACATCRIGLYRITTLGSAGDAVSPTRAETNVVRDSRGRYYLAPTAGNAPIAVYDSTGRFLKSLGRQREGAGEYQFVMRAEITPGDSIIALDVGSGRASILSPNHQFVRSFRMAGGFTRAYLMPPYLLVQGKVATAQAIGLPLHLLSPDGTIVRSFGSTKPETHRFRPQLDIRHVAPAGPGAVWTARLDRYEIEHWTLSGTMTRSIKRNAHWFPPWDYEQETRGRGITGPITISIWQDSLGMLWTMVRVPSPNAQSRDPHERRLPRFEVEDANTDTMIEVIDPSNGRLVASQRFPQFLIGHVEGDLVYSLRSARDGDLRVDIWRVQLTDPQRR